MARLNTRQVSSDDESGRLSSSPAQNSASASDTSASPAKSFGSDKENYVQGGSAKQGKRKSIGPAMSRSSEPESTSSNKRRRVTEKSRIHTLPSQATQTARQQERETVGNKKYYDPDQDIQTKRRATQRLRSLESDLNDNKAEYVQPQSKGLVKTLKRLNENFTDVKQTTVAAIDARVLVKTADLAHAKVKNLTRGDGSVGVDVDDFVSRCIMFMKREESGRDRAQPVAAANTQTQRRRRQQVDEEDEEDDGSAMNWQYLGKTACFLYNIRPCLSGFLLGPLSVQKKIRQQTQRKAREARDGTSQAVRPLELNEQDLDKQESANLTEVCKEISQLLVRAQENGARDLEEAYNDLEETPSDAEMRALMRKHGVSNNGCVPLFDFCVNPKSFGQTVENLFYVSFLIKEGKVGLDFDDDGLPTLGDVAPRPLAERQEAQRNQAVFTLDFELWEEIIQSYGIKKSIIPHRVEGDYDDGIVNFVTDGESGEVSDAYA